MFHRGRRPGLILGECWEVPAEAGLVLDGGVLNVEGPQWMSIKPKAQTGCSGFEGIVVAFVKTTLAGLHNPIDDEDAEGELDEAGLGRDFG